MLDLQKGVTIKTKSFKTVIVDQKLGEGGQGAVYRVDYIRLVRQPLIC
jgi:hypothetical protein